ncbi:mannosyltransferase [Maribacter polysaccharolyticus]|uniref:mannosyltransferase n=1 Tax=Maribacter polysaccharolyticus TaxID=3020831 RepID=UPI00237F391E|nr:mannosyltransferase [Maribacter polysaccharolyticus]MDE3742909.1 mannosyltransferase [Maribacter polysaccharolyticus]
MTFPIVTYWKLHKIPILIVILSLVFYYTFAYHLDRTDFIKLITLFGALFFFCYKIIQFEKWNFKFLLAVGLLFRLMFLCAIPNLSQDFYRFIWDGELVGNFINPYLHVPDTLITDQDLVISNAQVLYQGMGELSAKHFSNYPPLKQFIFGLCAYLGGQSILGPIMAMRSVMILSDLGILYFGRKLLKNLNLSPHLIFWYFLNPLVIVELTGNLHFEGVMLCFFITSLYLLSLNKWKLAAILYALSISIKLIPLMFLPLFLKYLGIKKSLLFYTVILVTTLLLTAPFLTAVSIDNYSQTVALWFSNFEFNAGLYNVIKEIAVRFDSKPWELIKTYGKIVPYVIILLVLLITFLRNNGKLPKLISSMLWILTAYYLLATTIHPWYIVFLAILSIFTNYRFPLVWSLAAILSYYAYSQTDFKEHMGLLAIEYILVYGFLIFEIFSQHGKKLLFLKK